jgi:hypothetical protein
MFTWGCYTYFGDSYPGTSYDEFVKIFDKIKKDFYYIHPRSEKIRLVVNEAMCFRLHSASFDRAISKVGSDGDNSIFIVMCVPMRSNRFFHPLNRVWDDISLVLD